jgi:predicted nucleotidyltransferase
MEAKIKEKLNEIERDYNIEILFAVESGSRAWGFASPDSDYDIRFVYKHSADWYLNLWEQKDTIQFMTEDDLDGSGWDIRKTLKLLSKSNASLIDWLYSPIVYKSSRKFLEDIKKVAVKNFNPVTGFFHYHNMSKSFEKTLHSEEMTLKSFFYAIRTALCANWIYKNETIPPVAFQELYPLLDETSCQRLDELLLLKSTEIEKSKAPVDKSLMDLVKNIIAENDAIKNNLNSTKPNSEDFNKLFLKQFDVLDLNVNIKNLALLIESKSVTSYGAQLGQVYCDFFDRNLAQDDFKTIKQKLYQNELIDNQKIDKETFETITIERARNTLIASIIKECKYEEHYMKFTEASQLADVFLNSFHDIEAIYCNSFWEETPAEDKKYNGELSLSGWNNISHNYWYDYGIFVISKTQIGVCWFGDDS